MATRSERRYGKIEDADAKGDEKTPDFGESKKSPKDESAPAKGPAGKKWKTKKDMKKGSQS